MAWPKGVSRKEWNEKMAGTPPEKRDTFTVDLSVADAERRELLDLLRWVGDKIKMRAANGRVGDHFCLICSKTNMQRKPCKHRRIWELTSGSST